jgi:hypothetical protein
MRLEEFQQEVVSRIVRYAAPVTDEAGEEAYELLIVGPEEQVRESFGESDFDVTIRPDVAEDEWREEAERTLFLEDQVVPAAALADPREWAKPPRREPPAEARILVAFRATRPGGTGVNFRTTVTLFGSFLLLFFPPPRFTWAAAQVRPTSGDPDLFLSVGAASLLAGVFSSVGPGLFPDTVWAQMIFGVSLPFNPTVTVVPFVVPSTTELVFTGWILP